MEKYTEITSIASCLAEVTNLYIALTETYTHSGDKGIQSGLFQVMEVCGVLKSIRCGATNVNLSCPEWWVTHTETGLCPAIPVLTTHSLSTLVPLITTWFIADCISAVSMIIQFVNVVTGPASTTTLGSVFQISATL